MSQYHTPKNSVNIDKPLAEFEEGQSYVLEDEQGFLRGGSVNKQIFDIIKNKPFTIGSINSCNEVTTIIVDGLIWRTRDIDPELQVILCHFEAKQFKLFYPNSDIEEKKDVFFLMSPESLLCDDTEYKSLEDAEAAALEKCFPENWLVVKAHSKIVKKTKYEIEVL